MRRLAFPLFVILLLVVTPACTAKKPVEQSYWKSKNILSIVRDMTKSYEQKDLDAFLSHVSNTYTDRNVFEKSLAGVFAKYETIHFTIQYTKMIVVLEEKGRIRTTFTWNAEWMAANGNALKDGSRVTLVFEPGDFKLLAVEGKNPYLALPGATPGKQ